MSTRDASHPYVAPGPDDSRSPCPGLNTLANHGYLPHDGRNLTFSQLAAAMHAVYGVSRPLAAFLAMGGLAKSGHWSGARRVLDLHALTRHGVLEHDGSLVHADVGPGETYASVRVDARALSELLDGQGQGQEFLSLKDLCRAQIARQEEARPLSATMALQARGELGLIYGVFGVPPTPTSTSSSSVSGGVLVEEKSASLDSSLTPGGVCKEGDVGHGERVVPKAFLEQWLGDERLPDGWEGPADGMGLVDLLALVKEIKALKDQMKKPAAPGSKGAAG